jgi:ubiquinone/menaquinone biosynthesis C-methylase UbiE
MDKRDTLWRNFYHYSAPGYDLWIPIWSRIWGFRDAVERRKMVAHLKLQPGFRVLEVSIGTGRNAPFIYEKVGPSGRIVGLDLAPGMLRRCRRQLRRWGIEPLLVEGNGTHLPFASNTFDAVLHFGAINEFTDKRAAVDEMLRVARPGACVVIGDEGLHPATRQKLRGKLLLRVSPFYKHVPPLEDIPPGVQDLGLSWFRGDACYLLAFRKP